MLGSEEMTIKMAGWPHNAFEPLNKLLDSGATVDDLRAHYHLSHERARDDTYRLP